MPSSGETGKARSLAANGGIRQVRGRCDWVLAPGIRLRRDQAAAGSGCGGEVAAVDGSDLSRGAGGLKGSAGPGHAAPADLAGGGVELPALLRIGLAGGEDVYENQLIGHVDMMAGGCDILSP